MNIPIIDINNDFSSGHIRGIINSITDDIFILKMTNKKITLKNAVISKHAEIAKKEETGILYFDFQEKTKEKKFNHPLIDYQPGSIRDDFDFGHILLINKNNAIKALNNDSSNYASAGLYNLRLNISIISNIVHINETAYTIENTDDKTGQFSYVDPKNRKIQMEMEKACTEYLKKTGAYLPPAFKEINLNEKKFSIEASVIIPVRNREKTISDAIDSVLTQKTDFIFNIIIVNNHSTDCTTQIIREKSDYDSRICHIIPERTDLGIGGCWKEAIESPFCGKFAIQLDSDDIYSDENTLQKIVNKFYEENCAMVIGSYKLCDFNLETIPPGIINHREWTYENGRNNALRINGLGAPRAFYTPVAKKIEIPNVSYGEDYAMELQISREYKTGRIFDVLYLCRRWEDNTDAALPQSKINENNKYKDSLRSKEILIRKNML